MGRRRPSDRLLIGGLVAVLGLGAIARAGAPTLVVEAPLVLGFLDGRTATLLLLHHELSTPAFVISTSVGMSLGDPIAFALGRRHGDDVLQVASRWLPTTSSAARRLEGVIGRGRGLPIVVLSGHAACALAGAAQVRWGWFLLCNAIGVALRLIVVIAAERWLRTTIDQVDRWIADWSGPLTGLTTLAVAGDLYVGHRRRRREVSG